MSFSFNVRKKLLPFYRLLWGCSVSTCSYLQHLLSSLDALYHGIMDCKSSTHHCTLYKTVAWSLTIQRTILGHFISLLFYSTEIDCLIHSQTCYYLYVPPVRTELKNSCKTAFKYTTTSDWNHFQTELRLHNLVSLSHLKLLYVF